MCVVPADGCPKGIQLSFVVYIHTLNTIKMKSKYRPTVDGVNLIESIVVDVKLRRFFYARFC